MNCGFIDVPCMVQGWFWGLVNLVPWWGWLAALFLVAVVVWRLLGWWGVVALAGIAGFVLGRRDEPFPTDLDPADRAESWTRGIPRKPTKRTAKRGVQPPDSLTK